MITFSIAFYIQPLLITIAIREFIAGNDATGLGRHQDELRLRVRPSDPVDAGVVTMGSRALSPRISSSGSTRRRSGAIAEPIPCLGFRS